MLEAVSKYCRKLLGASNITKLPFYNLRHTEEVVKNAKVIAQRCQFPEDEIEPILIAAWFHDTGFKETYFGHEEISKKFAANFLEENGYCRDKQEIVLSCIEATKMPQSLKNRYDEVLADADIFHIVTTDFFFKKLLLRREWELVLQKTYTDQEWHELNLKFLEQNHFFTSYCKGKIGKQKNLDKIRTILKFY